MGTDVRFADITTLLQDDGWKFEVLEENVVRMGLQGKKGQFIIIIRFRPEKELISVLVFYPFTVPEEKRQEVCEAIIRMNYGLNFGSCEMDMTDGELRYRSFMPCDDTPFVPGQFRTILITACATADRYYPAFMDVIWGGKSPETAIATVESQQDS